MSDTILKRSPPDDFDWPATIFLYVVLTILGVGMCFCLRRANRLIPNRFSFPLVERNEQPGFYDIGTEEEGLLHNYSDIEEEDNDAEVIDNQNALGITSIDTEEYQDHDYESDNEGHPTQSSKKQI